jgi:hypothetical protein
MSYRKHTPDNLALRTTLEVVVAMLASMATCPLSTLASWPCHETYFRLRIVYGDSALIAIGFSRESGEVSMKIAIMATGGVIARGQHLTALRANGSVPKSPNGGLHLQQEGRLAQVRPIGERRHLLVGQSICADDHGQRVAAQRASISPT